MHGNRVNIYEVERQDQLMTAKYTKEDDVLLGLGARYGSVSCAIELEDKNNWLLSSSSDGCGKLGRRTRNSITPGLSVA